MKTNGIKRIKTKGIIKMARFLIEVSHEANKEACDRTIAAFLDTGSHFLTHADWGCPDDEHKAWITIEVENKEEALLIVPPAFRNDTKIIQLENFSVDTIEENIQHHKD